MKYIFLQWKDHCLHKIFTHLALKSCFAPAFTDSLRVRFIFSSGTRTLWILYSPCLSSSLTHMHIKKNVSWKKQCKGTADDLCQAGCIRRTQWSKEALDEEEVSPLFQALSLIPGTHYDWWHHKVHSCMLPFYATELEAARPLIPPKLWWDLGTLLNLSVNPSVNVFDAKKEKSLLSIEHICTGSETVPIPWNITHLISAKCLLPQTLECCMLASVYTRMQKKRKKLEKEFFSSLAFRSPL